MMNDGWRIMRPTKSCVRQTHCTLSGVWDRTLPCSLERDAVRRALWGAPDTTCHFALGKLNPFLNARSVSIHTYRDFEIDADFFSSYIVLDRRIHRPSQSNCSSFIIIAVLSECSSDGNA